MKKIMTFHAFMLNERKKLNEGGGAGVDIKMDDTVSLEAAYNLTKDGVTVSKVDAKMGDTFSAKGYDDGMSNVGSWMLKLDDSPAKEIKRSSFNAIQLKFMDSNDFKNLMNDLSGSELSEDELNKLEEEVKTIEDLFAKFPDAELSMSFDMAMKNYREMHFGGWVRGDIGADTVVIGGKNCKYDTGDYDSVKLNDYDMFWTGEDALGDLIDEILPVIKSNKHFESFWKKVFRSSSEDYKAYVKDELLYKIGENELDEEMTDYIESTESENMPASLEDLKADTNKYIDDVLEWWMENKYDYFWDVYQNGLQDEFSPSNAPDETE